MWMICICIVTLCKRCCVAVVRFRLCIFTCRVEKGRRPGSELDWRGRHSIVFTKDGEGAYSAILLSLIIVFEGRGGLLTTFATSRFA